MSSNDNAPAPPPVSDAIIRLYDEYTHTPLGRRHFLDRLALLTGSMAAALALLPVLQPNYARAQQVPADDPRLSVTTETVPTGDGPLMLYAARPADAAAPLPAVVVIHENRGLNPYIEDVTRRVALAGYLALAPDFLSAGGPGTPDDPDQAREMIGALDREATLAHALAALDYARGGRRDVTGRTGVIGFCWGGGLANRVAVADPALDAAVAFYGAQPPLADVPAIEAALLRHYAGLDERINAGIADFTGALDAAGKDHSMHLYEGVNHAFHNDTAGPRYDEAAATLAWQRTLDFLDTHLRD